MPAENDGRSERASSGQNARDTPVVGLAADVQGLASAYHHDRARFEGTVHLEVFSTISTAKLYIARRKDVAVDDELLRRWVGLEELSVANT